LPSPSRDEPPWHVGQIQLTIPGSYTKALMEML